MILADYHLHSEFSSDSKAKPKDIIEQAISLGLKRLCFTDHMDYDYPVQNGYTFVFDPDAYFKTLQELQAEYKDKIKVLIGVELGLRPYLAERYEKLMTGYDFDFAIGSSHLIGEQDPYFPSYWEEKGEKQGMIDYFLSIIYNVNSFTNFDVYGHLDYALRYAPNKNRNFDYKEHSDLIDDMLLSILRAGKGIEVNTSGYKAGLGVPNPHPYLLQRYKELGGEIITIGSDSHIHNHLAYEFPVVRDLLLSLGYKYYAVYEKRKPEFLPL